jgi:hypothetical protein
VPSREIKTCEIFGMSIAFYFEKYETEDMVFSCCCGSIAKLYDLPSIGLFL